MLCNHIISYHDLISMADLNFRARCHSYEGLNRSWRELCSQGKKIDYRSPLSCWEGRFTCIMSTFPMHCHYCFYLTELISFPFRLSIPESLEVMLLRLRTTGYKVVSVTFALQNATSLSRSHTHSGSKLSVGCAIFFFILCLPCLFFSKKQLRIFFLSIAIQQLLHLIKIWTLLDPWKIFRCNFPLSEWFPIRRERNFF